MCLGGTLMCMRTRDLVVGVIAMRISAKDMSWEYASSVNATEGWHVALPTVDEEEEIVRIRVKLPDLVLRFAWEMAQDMSPVPVE
jgi:hypothetical protein